MTASRAALAVLALAAGLAVTGCGDGSMNASAADCGALAFDKADAAIVGRAYDAGKIGTRAKVQRKLGSAAFFTKENHLKPFVQLNSSQRARFDDWMRHDPAVLGATLDAQNATAQKIDLRCKKSK